VIVTERQAPFITTFPSPGDIVEPFTTILNMSWMCGLACEYCYLQSTRQTDHMLYTNVDEMEREFRTAPFAHWASLTIWSMLSFARAQNYLKIPEGLMGLTDKVRAEFVRQDLRDDRRVVDFLHSQQEWFYKELRGSRSEREYGLSLRAFCSSHARWQECYMRNKKYPFWLIASEFNDLLAVDHLTGYSNNLMGWLATYPEVHAKIRTKSAYVDELLRHNGLGRVEVQMTFNPQDIITQYEHGSSPLTERIEAARRIQDGNGFLLHLVVEPMIYTPDWRAQYRDMFSKIFTTVDPARVATVTVGSARYRPQLKAMIQKHYPGTTLFDPAQELQKPERTDQRLRYSVDRRVELYSTAIAEVRKYCSAPVLLGAENGVCWEKLELDKDKVMSETVYQYSPTEGAVTGQLADTPDADASPADQQVELAYQYAADVMRKEDELASMSEQIQVAKKSVDVAKEEIDFEYFVKAELSLEDISESQWREMYSIRISEATDGQHTWKPVKIVGRIAAPPVAEPISLQDVEISSCSFDITGLDGRKIEVLRMPYSNIGPLQTSGHYQSYLFCGTIVSIGTASGKNRRRGWVYRLYVKRILPDVTADDLVAERPSGGSTELQKIVDANSGTNGLLVYIKAKIVQGLGIHGLGTVARELGRALEAVILQAFSQGRDDGYSHRVHGLIFGPPNSGKSFLTRAAILLNPVGEEISCTAAKITAAGLIGSTENRNTVRSSEGGILPRNNGGVVCMQDFHAVDGGKRKVIFTIIGETMEKGVVLDSTSARSGHLTDVALLLDANRLSQVNKTRQYTAFEDINIPVNILSRFDFIIDIPEDPRRQRETALAITDQGILEAGQRGQNGWKKEVRMLVAYLRTRYRGAHTPEDVKEYLRKKVEEVVDELRGRDYNQELVNGIINRLTRSVLKFVKATACANATTVVKKEFVDYAITMLQDKLNFIRSFPAEADLSEIVETGRRDRIIAGRFRGETFTVKAVAEYLGKMGQPTVTERTLRRTLADIGAQETSKGKWTLSA
jgi:DNA repair photolyase